MFLQILNKRFKEAFAALDDNSSRLTNKCKISNLDQLKKEKFLTHRIFPRICENLHYEIMKYLNFQELLSIRGLKLGGYQLTANTILRDRIKNYLTGFHFDLDKKEENDVLLRKIELVIEQTGKQILDLSQMEKVRENHNISMFLNILRYLPQLKEIHLRRFFVLITNLFRESLNRK